MLAIYAPWAREVPECTSCGHSGLAEFVLEAWRPNHRDQCSCDREAQPDAELSVDTAVT
jgi:hypothetical protein